MQNLKKEYVPFYEYYNNHHYASGVGSFERSLYECFFKGDSDKKEKLVKAFPEYFGTKYPLNASWNYED